jgi:hypothetical protein
LYTLKGACEKRGVTEGTPASEKVRFVNSVERVSKIVITSFGTFESHQPLKMCMLTSKEVGICDLRRTCRAARVEEATFAFSS